MKDTVMSEQVDLSAEELTRNKILKSRENPIMLPTGLMIRGTPELLIVNFVDSEAEKIISSVAITKTLASDIRDAMEEFLIKTQDKE